MLHKCGIFWFCKFYGNCTIRGATNFLTSLRFVVKKKYLRSHQSAAACATWKTLKGANRVIWKEIFCRPLNMRHKCRSLCFCCKCYRFFVCEIFLTSLGLFHRNLIWNIVEDLMLTNTQNPILHNIRTKKCAIAWFILYKCYLQILWLCR